MTPSSSSVSNATRTAEPSVTTSWLWRWGPAVAAMVGIFLVSNLPNVTALPGGMSDKTGHFLAYGGLGMLVLRAVADARWGGVNANTSFAAWGITAAYGVSDEFHQRFVVGRTAAVDDWVADAAGAAVAIAVVVIVARIRAARRRAL